MKHILTAGLFALLATPAGAQTLPDPALDAPPPADVLGRDRSAFVTCTATDRAAGVTFVSRTAQTALADVDNFRAAGLIDYLRGFVMIDGAIDARCDWTTDRTNAPMPTGRVVRVQWQPTTVGITDIPPSRIEQLLPTMSPATPLRDDAAADDAPSDDETSDDAPLGLDQPPAPLAEPIILSPAEDAAAQAAAAAAAQAAAERAELDALNARMADEARQRGAEIDAARAARERAIADQQARYDESQRAYRERLAQQQRDYAAQLAQHAADAAACRDGDRTRCAPRR